MLNTKNRTADIERDVVRYCHAKIGFWLAQPSSGLRDFSLAHYRACKARAFAALSSAI